MKILIIEDDKSIAELERDYLIAAGFMCELAFDGESGLDKALKNDYDLVIIDIMLPGRDGFSARTEDIDKIRGLGLGADDYIAKPFSPSEMVARVRAHTARYKALKSGGARKPQVINVKGLSIDKDSRRVSVGQNEIILTVKEYDLLLFLIENPGIVFSKERLFDRIWGMDAIGDSSTVTVHVQRVRDKLEKYTDEKFIETVWGAGYRFAR